MPNLRTVYVVYKDRTCPPRNCHYTELLLERYNDISSTYVVTKKGGCNLLDNRSSELKVASESLSESVSHKLYTVCKHCPVKERQNKQGDDEEKMRSDALL